MTLDGISLHPWLTTLTHPNTVLMMLGLKLLAMFICMSPLNLRRVQTFAEQSKENGFTNLRHPSIQALTFWISVVFELFSCKLTVVLFLKEYFAADFSRKVH